MGLDLLVAWEETQIVNRGENWESSGGFDKTLTEYSPAKESGQPGNIGKQNPLALDLNPASARNGSPNAKLNVKITQATLVAPSGEKILILPGNTISVGRDESCVVSVPADRLMSRLHFSIECDAEFVTLIDLASTNGTTVNGQKATRTQLSHGDQICAGLSRFFILICS